jgi:branched-chain amino acid transport system ATP-binding protein
MAALLEVKNLEAFYGPTRVLEGIDFEVAEGGITTILGSNGAGKTTTLQLHLERPGATAPRARCASRASASTGLGTDEDWSSAGHRAGARRARHAVPQHDACEENLDVGAYLRRVKARGIEQRHGGACMRLLPSPEASGSGQHGGHALGRRAADAGDQPRR